MKVVENTESKEYKMNANGTDKPNYGIEDPKIKKEEKEIIKRKDIPNSPFTVITIGEESFGVMGKHRITEVSLDKQGIEEELAKFSWNRVIQVMMLMMDQGITKETTENK